MRKCLLACLLATVANAGPITYILSEDFSGVLGQAPGTSTIDLSFSEPAILTTDTVVTSFLSDTTSGDFSNCTISSVSIPYPVSSPSLAGALVRFASACSTEPGEVGEVMGSIVYFTSNLTSTGIYTAYFQAADTTVVGDLAITPEPAAVAAVSVGLLAIVGLTLWRRRAIRRSALSHS